MAKPDPRIAHPVQKALRRSSDAARAAKKNAASSLYLRDVGDLTLHGGVDATGALVVIPIFCGLGVRGLSGSELLPQTERLWSSDAFVRASRELGLDVLAPSLVRFRYPRLTAALPLPSAGVIDRILSQSDAACPQREFARSQLARLGGAPKWSVYRALAIEVRDSRETAQRLLDANDVMPGLVTDLFRPVLEMVLSFHALIDRTEAQGAFVLLAANELVRVADASRNVRSSYREPLSPATWSGYFRGIKEHQALLRAQLPETGKRLSTMTREQLRSLARSDPLRWGLFPDVGYAEALHHFELVADAAAGIWPEDVRIDLEGQSSWWGSTAASASRHCFQRLADAACFGWRILIDRAAAAGFYPDQGMDVPSLARHWARRFESQGIAASLASLEPSRPVGEGGALIVRHEATTDEDGPPRVRLEPAILRPHVAATKVSARAKAFPRLERRYWSLAHESAGDEKLAEGAPSAHYTDASEQVTWPAGKLWQAVDLVKTLGALPGTFLTPEMLVDGFVSLPADRWEALDLKPGAIVEDARSTFSWLDANDWFVGCVPYANEPRDCNRRQLYADPTTSRWPVDIVDGGLAVADVRLAVRFETVGSLELAGLLRVAKEFGVGGAPGESLAKEVAHLGASLRFVARPYFEVDGKVVEEADWFKAQKTRAGNYRLPNGQAVEANVYDAKTDQFVIRKRVYAKFRELRLGDIWSAQRQALSTAAATLAPDEYLRQLNLRIDPVLRDLDGRVLESLASALLKTSCPDLVEVARAYQADGIAWAYLRAQLGLGTCLADEMGLGKTLQAIALLRILRQRDLPSLVVMPKTLQINWRRELGRFGGELRIAQYGEDDVATPADVWLVTYPRLRLDQAALTERSWNLVVLDEAQAIKNSDSQTAAAAGLLSARHRLALTGTPLENRAAELWSLVDWLNPGYLGREGDFSTYAAMARSSEQKSLMLAPLRECLTPLILRRRKSDPTVRLDLPEKIQQDHFFELSSEQRALYEAVLEAVLAEDALSLGPNARRSLFLKTILHLKQICIHPDLFYGEQGAGEILAEIGVADSAVSGRIRNIVESRLKRDRHHQNDDQWLQRSGKLTLLRDLLGILQGESRGILLFTQYLGAAEMVRRVIAMTPECAPSCERTPFIHGGLSGGERQEIVDDFNEACRRPGGPRPILILSLKAGGTGLNLTGADHVLHLDRWWNPAVEDQASDRVHRIGQDRSVFIHNLTGQGTIEEAIATMFVEKRRLAEDLLGSAAAASIGEQLKDRGSFLDLVDPLRQFSSRLDAERGGRN